MEATAPIIVCGLGPIGRSSALLAGPRLAAIVDLDPGARTACQRELPRTVAAYATLSDALRHHSGAAVLLATQSSFTRIVPDLLAAAGAGSPVITSCEEACWPFRRHAEPARRVDAAARSGGVAILGTGINPGFLMDLLPATVAAALPQPELLRVTRRVDVAQRRLPLQEKVGVGLTRARFEELARADGIGHRGLAESIDLLGALAGVAWDETEVSIEPVLASKPTLTAAGQSLAAGTVIGMSNRGRAWRGGAVRVELELTMAYGLEAPVDRIEFLGEAPPLPVRLEIPGGIHGDTGTVRVLFAALRVLPSLSAGLRTLLDVPGGLRGAWE